MNSGSFGGTDQMAVWIIMFDKQYLFVKNGVHFFRSIYWISGMDQNGSKVTVWPVWSFGRRLYLKGLQLVTMHAMKDVGSDISLQ